MIRNGERRSRQACGERHFRILLLLLFLSWVFVSILCMKFSFSVNLTLSLSTSPREHRPINFVLGVARGRPCSTRGLCAPRDRHRMHHPVTFVLGVVCEYTCSTRGRCAPRGLCPICTSGTRVVQNLARRVGAVRRALPIACTAQSLSC